MKKLLLIALSVSFAFARPTITFKDNVTNFMKEGNHTEIRSRIPAKNAGIQSVIEWPTGETYSVAPKSSVENSPIMGVIKSACPPVKYNYITDKSANMIIATIKIIPVTKLISVRDTATYLNFLKTNLLSKIPASLNLEFSTVSFLFEGDSLAGSIVRMRRIFQNGILLERSSYLDIETDTKGNILRVETIWPEFKVNPLSRPMLTRAEAQTKVGSVLEQGYTSLEIAGDSLITIDNFTITGAANAWHFVILDGVETLCPAYVFSVEVTIPGNDTQTMSVAIPLPKKLYE